MENIKSKFLCVRCKLSRAENHIVPDDKIRFSSETLSFLLSIFTWLRYHHTKLTPHTHESNKKAAAAVLVVECSSSGGAGDSSISGGDSSNIISGCGDRW